MENSWLFFGGSSLGLLVSFSSVCYAAILAKRRNKSGISILDKTIGDVRIISDSTIIQPKDDKHKNIYRVRPVFVTEKR